MISPGKGENKKYLKPPPRFKASFTKCFAGKTNLPKCLGEMSCEAIGNLDGLFDRGTCGVSMGIYTKKARQLTIDGDFFRQFNQCFI